MITFPLPALAGGGNASIGVKLSSQRGHVDLVITSQFLNGTVTLPADEIEAFGRQLSSCAAISRHGLAAFK